MVWIVVGSIAAIAAIGLFVLYKKGLLPPTRGKN
jgi:hypothetical protein